MRDMRTMNVAAKITAKTLLGLGAFALLLICGLPHQAAAEEPVCYECHDAFEPVGVPHDPADSNDCTACHEDHGDDEELRLVEEGSALCFQCHDEFEAVSASHAPVEDGECTACHNPHGSNHGGMLIAEAGSALCYECHDEFEAAVSMHPPVEDGECNSCHNPHGSNNEAILIVAKGELCRECHDDGMEDPVVHAALDDGCSECHLPHTSEFPKLFSANLTLERIARFEEQQAELCLNCHDLDALLATTTEDTDFRHGSRNLHSLHLTGGATPNKYGFIKKKDGQTCVACHLPHSALQERLIRTEFECKGIYCYTMRFRPNESGGTCIVGCHKPQTYSRNAEESGAAPKTVTSSYVKTP